MIVVSSDADNSGRNVFEHVNLQKLMKVPKTMKMNMKTKRQNKKNKNHKKK